MASILLQSKKQKLPRSRPARCELWEIRLAMTQTHNPADPRDPRHALHALKPIWESFDMAVEGNRPVEHAHRIERLLKGVHGVKKVAAHLTEERVTVTYDARAMNPAAIHELLLQRGYKAAARVD
jgi:copper chaperone CopZ